MLPVWEHPKSIVDSHTLHQHCSLKIERKKKEKWEKKEKGSERDGIILTCWGFKTKEKKELLCRCLELWPIPGTTPYGKLKGDKQISTIYLHK